MNHRRTLLPRSAAIADIEAANWLSMPWLARPHIHNWPKLVWLRRGGRRPVVLRLRSGLRVACRPRTEDWSLLHGMCRSGAYGAAFRYLAKRDRHGLVLDLGAHTGYFTLWCTAVSPGVQVLAYEPAPSNAAAFTANLDLNPRLAERIVLETIAVSGVDGTSRVSLPSHGDARPAALGHAASVGKANRRETAFDTIVRRLAGPIELVKMDIGGAEFSVLDETPADLWERIPAIFMTIHEDQTRNMVGHRLIRRFEALGYAASTDERGSLWFERTGPRWRRSTVQPAAQQPAGAALSAS